MIPVCFLPGMMCDARLFGPQLSRFGTQRTCVVGDITRGDTIETLATDVLAEAPERFALVGLSMGGIVAIEIIRRAPDRVASLALLDTNHRAETETRRALRGPQIGRALRGELRSVLTEEMKPLYLAEANRRDSGLLDLVLDMALSLGPDVFARQSRALRDRRDGADVLRGIRCPTLVLCGAEDRLCPPDRHREIAGLIPGAELVLVPEAGHLSTLERPDPVNAALAHLLERGDAA